MKQVALKNLNYRWRTRHTNRNALEGLSAEFKSGIFNFICGPSGSGKTTFALLSAGLIKPDSGTVRYQPASLANRIAMVFQFPETLFLEESVEAEFEALYGESVESNAGEWLSRVGLDYRELSHRHTSKLSAAEGRLTAIALQLSRSPEMLILDEPTIGLDTIHRMKLAACLKHWLTPDRIALIITHDLSLMRELGGQTAILRGGKLEIILPTGDLLSDNHLLQHYELK